MLSKDHLASFYRPTVAHHRVEIFLKYYIFMSVLPFDPCDYDSQMKILETVSLIHASSFKACLIITGGGTELLSMLLRNGDGSKTLTSSHIPYAIADLRLILDLDEEAKIKPVSLATSFALAGKAYVNACFIGINEHSIGISMTASLQRIEEERLGRPHQAFVSYRKYYDGRTYRIDLTPSSFHPDFQMRRRLEEAICAEAGLWALAVACGVRPHRDDLPMVEVQRYPDLEFDDR